MKVKVVRADLRHNELVCRMAGENAAKTLFRVDIGYLEKENGMYSYSGNYTPDDVLKSMIGKVFKMEENPQKWSEKRNGMTVYLPNVWIDVAKLLADEEAV